MSNPFDDEMRRRAATPSDGANPSNPFEAELSRRASSRDSIHPDVPLSETALDVGDQAIRRFNKGLAYLVTSPYRLVDWAGEKATGGDFLPNVEEMPLYKPFMQQPEAKTDAGRYAGAAAEVLGASAIPSGALLANAQRMAAVAPTTAGRAVVQNLGSQIASRPGAAVAADAVAATGAGFGQQAAEDAGFGPAGQMVAGIAGGVAPFAAAAPFGRARHAVNKARYESDPHAKVAASLPFDQSIDDLAQGIATGTTGRQGGLSARIFDTLGEEMVAAGGNRQVALANTLRRLEVEGGVAPSTARDQLRRVVQAQADNELMLGEYPAVLRSNENTRGRNADVILRELDYAQNMPNREAASRHRLTHDPGRIEDAGTHWLMDTVANSGSGPSSQIVRTSVNDRLAALRDQARTRIRNWAPNQATLQDADDAINRMTQAGRAAYRRVYDAPGGTAVNYGLLHPLLARVVERHLGRLGGFAGDQGDALRKALNGLYLERPAGVVARGEVPALEDQLATARQVVREARRQGAPKEMIDDASRYAEGLAEELRLARRDATPGVQRYLLPTLEQLQNMRSAIRGQLEDFRNQGRRDMEVVLGPLYRDITRVMERASPQWRIANRQWADLQLDVLARELGENLSERAGPMFRQQMRQFRQLAPEAQDFVRVEFTQKLLDKVQNTGVGDDLAKLFKTPHIRTMIRTILGDEAAVDMLRLVRDNQVASKTKNMMGGSPTAPRLARQQELDADIGLVNAVDQLPTTPSAIMDALKRYTIHALKERRNRRIAGIVTTPMRDTAAVAEHIERMRAARNLANRYATRPQRQRGVAGLVGSILNEINEDTTD